MSPKHYANIIAYFHLLWLLFGVVSLPLMFFVSGWHIVTLIYAALNILSWLLFNCCLLLKWENIFRKKHAPDEAFLEEGFSFIQHYLKKIFNINCKRSTIRIFLHSYMAALIIVAVIELF